jgi:hypothetical protein
MSAEDRIQPRPAYTSNLSYTQGRTLYDYTMRTVSVLAIPLRRSAIVAARQSSRRCFSSSTQLQATWGFIGLGRMG